MPAAIASVGMSSTADRQRAYQSRSSGLQGASAKPQLLITTEVTPCQHEQLPSGSHATCASMWVWPSMKPGDDDQAVGIDRARGGRRDAADLDDAAVLDADIGGEARLAGAVDDGAAADEEIEGHQRRSLCSTIFQ